MAATAGPGRRPRAEAAGGRPGYGHAQHPQTNRGPPRSASFCGVPARGAGLRAVPRQRTHPFAGRFLNVEDGERRSYRPRSPAGVEPLRLRSSAARRPSGSASATSTPSPRRSPDRPRPRASRSSSTTTASGLGVVAGARTSSASSPPAASSTRRLLRRLQRVPGAAVRVIRGTRTHYGASSLQALASAGTRSTGDRARLPRRAAGTGRGLRAEQRPAPPPAPDGPRPRARIGRRIPPSATPDAQQEAALRGSTAARRTGSCDAAGRAGVPIRSFWQPIEAGWSRSVTDALLPVSSTRPHVPRRSRGRALHQRGPNERGGARIVAAATWDEWRCCSAAAATVPRR